VMRVSVCRSVCYENISQKPHIRTSPNSLHMLPVAVSRFSSSGVAIRYVYPVFWRRHFHMGPMAQATQYGVNSK